MFHSLIQPPLRDLNVCGRATVVVLLVLLFFVPCHAWAQPGQSLDKHHPWAAFSPGAWKLVRAVAETYDADGVVTGTGETETKTTLTTIDNNGVTLEVAVAVWVAGKRLDPQPQSVRQGFFGESEGEKVAIKELPAADVIIEGRTIPCRVQEVQTTDAANKWVRTTKVFINDDVAPYVLKRETVTKECGKDAIVSRTSTVVDALGLPCETDRGVLTVAHARTVVHEERGVTTTLAYLSTDVPGGVVCQWSKEEDKLGRPLRRTVSELIDFGLEPEVAARTGLFQRRLRSVRTRIGTRCPDE